MRGAHAQLRQAVVVAGLLRQRALARMPGLALQQHRLGGLQSAARALNAACAPPTCAVVATARRGAAAPQPPRAEPHVGVVEAAHGRRAPPRRPTSAAGAAAARCRCAPMSLSAACANSNWRGAKRPGSDAASPVRWRKNVTWKPSGAACQAARASRWRTTTRCVRPGCAPWSRGQRHTRPSRTASSSACAHNEARCGEQPARGARTSPVLLHRQHRRARRGMARGQRRGGHAAQPAPRAPAPPRAATARAAAWSSGSSAG